jgi:hypothetical protein
MLAIKTKEAEDDHRALFLSHQINDIKVAVAVVLLPIPKDGDYNEKKYGF